MYALWQPIHPLNLDLNNGVYLVRVENGIYFWTQKIIIGK
jgi:hypothetical protein